MLRLLRPLVRVLLRYGFSYGAFAELAKRVYVEVAQDEFRIPGRKQTTSRVAVLTGLSRKEVRRVRELEMPSRRGETLKHNRAARVIGGWVRDQDFRSGGEPRALEIESEFAQLCRRYSGDMPTKAVLAELLRSGAVELDSEGAAVLRERAFVPSASEIDKISFLGSDVADLAGAIDHNLEAGPAEAFLQRKVCYDNLPEESVEELRKLVRVRGQKLLENLDRRMAPLDRNINPQSQGSGRKRVAIGIYYFESDYDGHDDEQD